MTELHACTVCGQGKAGSAFYWRMRKNGRQRTGQCKECVKDKIRKFYKKNPGRSKQYSRRYRAENRERHLSNCRAWHHANKHKIKDRWLRQYGLTGEQFRAMNEMQRGLCAICSRPPRSGKRLNVDHCHATGKVRGLLCTRCNTALGAFGDTAEMLTVALLYVQGQTL